MSPGETNAISVPSGPPIYENWLAFHRGEPWLFTEEFPIRTDAHLTSEVTQGPYTFFNTVPRLEPGIMRAAVVVRCDWHLSPSAINTRETNVDLYHGGLFPDEIAACVSLALGIRAVAGGITRRFDSSGDPKGRPMERSSSRVTQASSVARRHAGAWVVPSAVSGEHFLDNLRVLEVLTKVSAAQAVTLIRAARLY